MAGETFGFVGLGHMGQPMALRLLEAGHPLVVFDRDPAAMAPLAARGARVASSLAEVGRAARVVFGSLPTPDVVLAVASGPDGLADGGMMKVFVDTSTTGPRVERQLAERLAARQIEVVDCPVSGGISGAMAGTLAVIVSGKSEVVNHLKPVLSVLGQVFYVGPEPGGAQTMKLINNLSSATALAIISEGLVLGAKAGLDPDMMITVLNAGSGRNSATEEKIPRAVLPRTFDFGFAIGLSCKDVGLCLQEAEALGVPMLVGAAVRQLVGITARQFGPDADMTSIIRTVEEWAGTQVRGSAVGEREGEGAPELPLSDRKLDTPGNP
ncbi:NAD(P)-dependent oxidoreductase [Xanthobacter flavus]|uniref:NAD(P)-dependent oxidoreductase n=1 Tax=Xanthobacter flavus TaxID=281 RepID=UPI00372BFDCB